MNPDGTVSTSDEAPLCSVPGCTQHAVPGSATCGNEDHMPQGGVAGLQDGSASPAANSLLGYGDGTGRSLALHLEMITTLAEKSAAEGRDYFTDWDVAYDLKQVKMDLAGVQADQLTDDDADTDPLDAAVSAALDAAMQAVDAAIKAQAADMKGPVELDSAADVSETREAEEPAPVPAEQELDEVVEDETPAEVDDDPEPDVSERSRGRYKPRKRSAANPDPRGEVRLRVSDLEIRSATDGDIVLRGTPIVYKTPYTVHDMFGSFRETMAPSVCDSVLGRASLDCRFLFNHDGLPLARTASGTLELINGPNGLESIAHLDDRQQLANDLAVAIERGDVSQMSCGFIVADDSWNDDYSERTINFFQDLLDVSAVTYPASPTTHIGMAQRMMFSSPEETRSRLRMAVKAMNEVRAGKVLSTQNANLIMSALESLHKADEADPAEIAQRAQAVADAHQDALGKLAQVSGLDPAGQTDGADGTTVEDPGDGIRSDEEPETETRDDELAREQAAELRRKHILAKRNRLARNRYLG